ncbi:hypothetical protein Taro_048516 [Colocasia esculenta]|uniref:Metalloenzyme domain-containing protein n=1 Tax=Colocasia esculenta TaxID=4460 RepID=A0A843X8C4_COLES|nr:hypothetical protein [Colocasia esculenta]
MAKNGEGPTMDIDVGMTYSYVGIWQHDRVEIIANGQGNWTAPSYVAFTDTECLIGKIAEKARDAILGRKYDQVRVNLPNGDMVGHTGDIEATIVACKAADEAVKMIIDAIEQVGGVYVVTADHGNAEDMVKRNKSGQPLLDKSGNIQILTSHTLQLVFYPWGWFLLYRS